MTTTENNKQITDQIVRDWVYESEQGATIYDLCDYVKTNYGSDVLANNDIMNDAIARLGYASEFQS
jgi:hypothetical protein